MERMVKEQGGLNQINDEDFHTWTYSGGSIDYGEVFAPVARIEAIRLFLAYAFFIGFMTLFIKKQKGDILLVQVYVYDIIFGSTTKEMCKAFKRLMKDKFQIIKRIFRYLKGKPQLSLWYPKGSPFNLVAYSDSDDAGAILDRKSTTGGYQFLGEDVTTVKEVNAAEPTVFDDEKVTITMAQTLIKMKAEKARILDEQMAKRLQDEEIEQAAAREKQEKEDLERAKVLQQQYDQKQENIDWNWMFLIHTLVQCVSAKRTSWNEFSCSMASAVICLAIASPPPQAHTPIPHALPPSPPQEQPTLSHDSTIPLLTTLMETCATLSQKVTKLEQDKNTQALEILKLKKRVKKLEKRRSQGFLGEKIKAIDTDEEITLMDVETQKEVADMEAKLHGRITQKDVSAATKDVSDAEPTVFDDEDVTMTRS
nr:uncharacterized mitochondrial protein AtMg00810-like [Tanacetum cinerariifolium]